MRRLRQLLVPLVGFLVAGLAAGGVTYAALDASSSNAGNSFTAGKISIQSNDSGNTMFNVSGLDPADPPVTRCIELEYTGDVSGLVRLYGTSAGALAQHLDLKVERGTGAPAFPNCTGFSPTATVYDGALDALPASWSSGLAEGTWAPGEKRPYRFTVTVDDVEAAQGLSGAAEFTWEARE
jgi:hypothetical protein